MDIILPPRVSGGADSVLDGLELFSLGGTASVPNEDREDLLRPFHRDRRVKLHVLFTAITDEDELGLGEAVEDIDNSLAFSSRRSRQETVKQ